MKRFEEVLQDEPIRNEIRERVEAGENLPRAHVLNVSAPQIAAVVARDPATNRDNAVEAVIIPFGRPVLLVRNNRFALPDSDELKKRLLPAKKRIEKALPSVGRLEFVHHPTRSWDGSGWMIAERTIVTNRHIAERFATRSDNKITFNKNHLGQVIGARIDFREEYLGRGENQEPFEVGVEQVLFMERHDQAMPDVAFLKLSAEGSLPSPIPIGSQSEANMDIVVIGYPAEDSRGFDSREEAKRIFGDIYDVKRVAPGKVLVSNKEEWYFTHDASTLGGNSGSAVIDIDTGNAIGLHFLGYLHRENYAVKGKALLDELSKLRVQVAVPIAPSPVPPVTGFEGVEEGKPEDYENREGYNPSFLGAGKGVPLPDLKGHTKTDALKLTSGGGHELAYTHFSVVMSKSRKLCLFSAANIDGETSKKTKRTGWRLDPRIPKVAQTYQGVYGNEPKFARGHMTRREDPVWGTKKVADAGNSDSMHLTNAVPQMQPFNAGIWLGLEDYALQHARQDDMKISVFTGPILRKDDPERYGVKVPIEFWKVIAFVHDVTKKLCATGYIMSQEDYLSAEEFVFGQHATSQVPIASIEVKTGLGFGKLPDIDPLKGIPEGVAEELTDWAQIRFV
jgi:endonuclease G, mitochondrial